MQSSIHRLLQVLCIGLGTFPSAIQGRLKALERQKEYNQQLLQAVRSRISMLRGQVQEEEQLPVIIGFAPGNDELRDNIESRHVVRKKFQRINALSALISRTELLDLQQNPDVLYVDQDVMVYPDEEEDEPILYGLNMVQAFDPVIPAFNISAACSDPNSFKVGIVDSGLAINHPDIPCLPYDDENTNCIGKEFGIEEGDGVWYDPIRKYHGTHVAGIIGASGQNNIGVQGVINDGNICFMIARVFGESSGGTRMSSIFEAVEWLVDQGAKVINLSLGVDSYVASGDEMTKAAYEAGTIMVAASGNSGTDTSHYPANYANVLSVAAVDANQEHATFSQYNSGVDIAAPGVDILSTLPQNMSSAIFLSSENVHATGVYFENSVPYSEPISGPLILCPNYGNATCPGSGGHICLIERGAVTLEEKTLNCQLGGGVATLIYNNEAATMEEELIYNSAVTIPSLHVTMAEGYQLKSLGLEKTLTIEQQRGYGYLSGTSMAAPYVTGVIAKIWRSCPLCTNQEVERCLLSTTVDLGETGKDVYYGNGLIQAAPAYQCLINTEQCC